MIDHCLAKQGSPDLQHEIVVLAETQRQDAVEAPQCSGALT
jgi:hypothetical protein